MTARFKEAIRGWLPLRLKMHRIRRGPLAGCFIYTSWHDYPGAIRGDTESSLLAWLARNVNAGETWLDVGAHYGYTAIALSRLVGATGRVVAFEPVLTTAGCISRTREANRLAQLQIVPLGLSSEAGISTLRMPVYRGMADAHISKAGWNETILVAGFDRVWESLCQGNPAIHGIKVDVQGMEGLVLRGMVSSLRQWHPRLVIEFHSGVDRKGILDLLALCGYNPQPEALEGSPFHAIDDDKSYAFV